MNGFIYYVFKFVGILNLNSWTYIHKPSVNRIAPVDYNDFKIFILLIAIECIYLFVHEPFQLVCIYYRYILRYMYLLLLIPLQVNRNVCLSIKKKLCISKFHTWVLKPLNWNCFTFASTLHQVTAVRKENTGWVYFDLSMTIDTLFDLYVWNSHLHYVYIIKYKKWWKVMSLVHNEDLGSSCFVL